MVQTIRRRQVVFVTLFCLGIIVITNIRKVTHLFPERKQATSGFPFHIGNLEETTSVSVSFQSDQDDSPSSSTDVTLAIDDSVARELSSKIRLACFITTREINIDTKLKAVNETWGRRCDKMIYVMTSNRTYPDVLSVNVTDKHGTLTEKIRTAFTHMRRNYLDSFDWFLKADDDTYVIVENLKFFLSHFDSRDPVVVGDHFKAFSPSGYMAGGAGYVLSREALRQLVDDGYRTPGRCRLEGGSEDIETARCLDKLGVPKYLSLDKYNRSTFHANRPEMFTVNVTNFVYGFRFNKYIKGLECCSQLAISFHYIKPEMMMTLDLLLYRVSVFGRTLQYKKLQDMFRVEQTHIPRGLNRQVYPGETIDEYYDHIAEWRRKNTTIFIKKQAKNNSRA